jgi:uncharacterized protein (DUF2126 family)/transglutaminase-like putative cysteine protease
MRLLVQHQSTWAYPSPAALGPHLVRLRPANHTKADIETYGLTIEPAGDVRWQQDPYGNHIARLTYPAGTRIEALQVGIEFTCDIKPVNPFDFFVDDRCKSAPFAYPAELLPDLAPFFDLHDPSVAGGPRLTAFLESLPREGDTVQLIVALNEAVNRVTRYVIREEPGIWTPEQTLVEGRGSCRDSAVLLIAALRSRGLAARFVSGYLIQLTDEGMIPGAPRGVSSDVVDLHAWAEVYVPGGGWIGLDATSGLLCGEGHIPLACTVSPPLAAPVEGTSDTSASGVSFSMRIERLEHEPRPTRPYEEHVWHAMLDAGDRADAALSAQGLQLTLGGEPTFNGREHPEAPEWNGDALGPDKTRLGRRFAAQLLERLAPGGIVMERVGKHYPGESLPRWALDIIGRRDGTPIWTGKTLVEPYGATPADASKFAAMLSGRLGLGRFLIPAFEDPWRAMQDEANLPMDVDPLTAKLDDPEERRRLARLLDRGISTEAGYVLPLTRFDDTWVSDRWTFRRGTMFLIPGDGPMGLRLPLQSLGAGYVAMPEEAAVEPPDPRRAAQLANEAAQKARMTAVMQRAVQTLQAQRTGAAPLPPPMPSGPSMGPTRDIGLTLQGTEAVAPIRTALCVEARDGAVRVFFPPLATADDFLLLLSVVDKTAQQLGVTVALEGYPPPSTPSLQKFCVTPDPGVLEVALPPVTGIREHAALVEQVFDVALHSGLHSEKYLLDGRMAGSGGGNHITFGGPDAVSSPFLTRPDLLASLLTFLQHHPSLSYLFSGLFVGPTSEAPRVDEARHDALYELEIALQRAHDRSVTSPPWLADMLFRHLLVDVSGNTHRAEVSIDKLFDPGTPYGRQGIIELRAFEMPPHPRMITAQALLVRSLLATFAEQPYQAPLVRWGQTLHDKFLLPTFLWRDVEDVLSFLDARGFSLPADAYKPFIELRCPLVGSMETGDVVLEVRNAIEPWPVLGEESSPSGTSRYVDSSMERIEVRVLGAVAERHAVLVNGHRLPLRASGVAGELVGGVRFRAWAPPHSLHAHLGIHHPISIDIVDTWGQRSLGACAYHVWHPEGRSFDTPPLTRFEAAARRAQRFTHSTPVRAPVVPRVATAHGDVPYTLDLRRLPIDRPPPEPDSPQE